MSTKSKLLEAIGAIDFADIGDEALVDILVGKIHALEVNIKTLHGENAAERERLRSEIEASREDRRRMQRDPLYCARGDYFFKGNSGHIHVFIQGEVMQLTESRGKCDYILEQISSKQYYISRG